MMMLSNHADRAAARLSRKALLLVGGEKIAWAGYPDPCLLRAKFVEPHRGHGTKLVPVLRFDP